MADNVSSTEFFRRGKQRFVRVTHESGRQLVLQQSTVKEIQGLSNMESFTSGELDKELDKLGNNVVILAKPLSKEEAAKLASGAKDAGKVAETIAELTKEVEELTAEVEELSEALTETEAETIIPDATTGTNAGPAPNATMGTEKPVKKK